MDPAGTALVLELRRLGLPMDAGAGGQVLDLVAWIAGRLGARPWTVFIHPHQLRPGPEREIAYGTRSEAGEALLRLAASIPEVGVPDPA